MELQSSASERETALAQRDVKLQELRDELERTQREHVQLVKVKDAEIVTLRGRLDDIHRTVESAGAVQAAESEQRKQVSDTTEEAGQ